MAVEKITSAYGRQIVVNRVETQNIKEFDGKKGDAMMVFKNGKGPDVDPNQNVPANQLPTQNFNQRRQGHQNNVHTTTRSVAGHQFGIQVKRY